MVTALRQVEPVTEDEDELEPPVMLPLPEKPQVRQGRARAGGVVCPCCFSQAHVEKISHVVRNGRGSLYWEDGEVAHYETELSKLLEAPPRPREVPILRAALGLLLPLGLLALSLLVFGILDAQEYVVIPQDSLSMARNISLAWFGLIVPGAMVIGYARSRMQLRKKLPVWRVAHRRWTGLYYCSHDDVVFEPHLNRVAAPREVDALLYVPGAPDPRVKPKRAWARGLSALGIVLVVASAGIASISTAGESQAVLPSSPEERATPISSGAEVEKQQTVEVIADRADCNQIRGTDYRSDSERTWYLANCLQ